MPAYFVQLPNARYPDKPPRRVNLDEEPIPTIAAKGVGDAFLGPYHLEHDGRVTAPVPAAKPPYRIPSVAEILATPWNGLTHASTFSGAGGTCMGFRMAGFKTVWANDCDKRAIACYRKNFPDALIDERPIQQITADEILAATGLARGELDVFEGSPPCTAFSTAGKLAKGWRDTKEHAGVVQQNVEDLFFEWLRLLDGLRPRAFTAENVSGMVKGVAKGYFLAVLKAMREMGYRTKAQVLDAQWMGVPQARQRVIFIGVREDLGVDPVFPTPLPYRYSVRDALPWLSDLRLGAHGFQKETRRSADEPSTTIASSGMGSYDYDVGVEAGAEPVADARLMMGETKHEDVTDRPAKTVMATLRRDPRDPEVVVRVTQEKRFGDPKVDVTDRPALTVRANGGNGGDSAPVVEARLVHTSTGQHASQGDVTDRPAPTVAAAGQSTILHVEEQRVIHDTGNYVRDLDVTDRPSPTIVVGRDGSSAAHLKVETRRVDGGDVSERARRGDPDEPSPTVLASSSGFSDVDVVRRKLTILEVKRLCAFPDDYDLTPAGGYGHQWARCGNSVPPLMARGFAVPVRDLLLAVRAKLGV